jgi:hypothetical protein
MNLQIINTVRCNGVLTEITYCINKCDFFNHIDEITNELVCNKKRDNAHRYKYNKLKDIYEEVRDE